jgi:ankyrin repeat protein
MSGQYASELLTACCKEDNHEALQFFAETAGFNLNCFDKNGRNLFHLCAIFGSVKCMVILSRHNIPMGYRDNEGNLPVHYSCIKKSITTLRFLTPFSAMN